jgi:anaerobic ribonucleoside-triphosphate reductase
MVTIVKKDGSFEIFQPDKIKAAIQKSANRVMVSLTENDFSSFLNFITDKLKEEATIDISNMHLLVENALDQVNPAVAKSYRDYRNYTQRSLIYGELNSELYKKFFLNKEERTAMKEGYIYIHGRSARLDTINCCLWDMSAVLNGSFEMGNIWYNEPKTLDVAFDVISDITMSAAAIQYDGFTIPEVDSVLALYAEKSYQKYKQEYIEITGNLNPDQKAENYAYHKIYHDFEQGFQSWEYRFNTVESSQGDYPFIAVSFGIDTSIWSQMATQVILKVREGGQGKTRYKKPVLFPKLTFLYDEILHGKGQPMEHLFNLSIDCSSKAMYPDFLSLTGEGYIPSIYKKYGKVVSLMGCRVSLAPWYEKGGMKPVDKNDIPVFTGRFNMGAISLHLPMILAKSRQENKDFYEVLSYYLELIRNLHKKLMIS